MRRFLTLFSMVMGLLLLFILPLNEGASAQGNKIDNYSVHALIHSDGSATITEKVTGTFVEGTEFFHIIEHLGSSKISHFTVEENGRTYEFVDNWNTDASLEDKAYKNGIIETSSGYELSWGLSEYGLHEYTAQYFVTDFIKQLDDSQVLLWRFINELNIPAENINIEIEAEDGLNIDEGDVWVFGSNNNTSFENDKFVVNNSVPFANTDYATVLMKFPKDQFPTTNNLNQTFNVLYDRVSTGNEHIDQYMSEPSTSVGDDLVTGEDTEDEISEEVDSDESEDNLTEDATAEQDEDSNSGFPFWLFIVIPLLLLFSFGIIILVVGIFIFRAYKKKQNQ